MWDEDEDDVEMAYLLLYKRPEQRRAEYNV